MPGLQDIFNTIRNYVDDPVSGARVGSWVRMALDEQAQERLHLMLAWVERVHARSFAKWYRAGVLVQCRVTGRGIPCPTVAIGPCSCCGRPVCIQHAMISADADLLCAQCFTVARVHAQPFRPEEPAPQASGVDLEQAYRILRCKPSSTDEEVRKAHKKMAFKHHPDRKKSETAKANADARFKEIQAAWSTIAQARGMT